jgi:hypothetical protein
MDGGSRAYYCGHKTRLLCQTGRMETTVVALLPAMRGIIVK